MKNGIINSPLATPPAATTRAYPAADRRVAQHVRWAPLAIIFLGGANLILVQWVTVREITTLLLGTELVILLTAVAYFAGISLGYMIANWIRAAWLLPLAVITLVLHLALPVIFRLAVTWMGSAGYEAVAILLLPLLTPFVVSAFYSIFLPRFIDGGQGDLPTLYLVELAGSAFGVLALVFLGQYGLQPVMLVYSVGLLFILLALGLHRHGVVLLAAAAGIWLALLPHADAWSNERWYETVMGFPAGTAVLFSGYSPYQKVDVLQLPTGERALYLDGLSHFNAAHGVRLNIIVGEVPGELLRPQNALVIGAGVMQTEQMLAQYGGQVTTVELDPMVADVGERLFLAYNQMDKLTNRTVVVDDAKHFLANSHERYDLVVADTPAAFSVQPATLYSAAFYQHIASHLTPGGVLVANMTSPFTPDDLISRRVAASLLEAFDEVIVVTPASVGWSFAFAGDDLPFDRQQLEAALRAHGEVQFTVMDTTAVRAVVGDAPPITLDSMDFVWQTSLAWIAERLYWR
ncbi:MAG: fused MFS/spermidine synthase [Anaerolineae bacterium]|nr:fused MFS/spermidine synthase [Anaerolineae bacterium]